MYNLLVTARFKGSGFAVWLWYTVEGKSSMSLNITMNVLYSYMQSAAVLEEQTKNDIHLYRKKGFANFNEF